MTGLRECGSKRSPVKSTSIERALRDAVAATACFEKDLLHEDDEAREGVSLNE